MPVGAFVPSELEFDYLRWTAPAIGSTDTGKAWAWNNVTGKYEPTTFLLRSAVSAYGLTLIDDADAATARTTLGLGTMAAATETDYLLASGTRAGATSSRQRFTEGATLDNTLIINKSAALADNQPILTVDTDPLYGPQRSLWIKGPQLTSSRIFLSAYTLDLSGVSAGIEGLNILDLANGQITFGGTTVGFSRISGTYSLAYKTSFGNEGHFFQADGWNNTNTIANILNVRTRTSGTPSVGYGIGIAMQMESSTTVDQNAGRLTWEWVTATHASRASRGKLSAYYTSTEQNAMTWDGDTGGLKLGFYGGTPVAKAAAYTQTYSTADRTLAAYTSDTESVAYTGIDNAQAGTVYATVADLDALRTAYENLRAFVEDLAQHHNAVVDDLQALNLVG